MEVLLFIIEEKCFNYKKEGYTILNCSKKTKGFIISDILNRDNIENIN